MILGAINEEKKVVRKEMRKQKAKRDKEEALRIKDEIRKAERENFYNSRKQAAKQRIDLMEGYSEYDPVRLLIRKLGTTPGY